MIIFIIILIWLLCGILAFRINCRVSEEYEYQMDGFSGFFMILLLGVLSLILCVIYAVSRKLEDWQEPEYLYHIKKKLYEFIVGKEPKRKNTKENE